MLAAILTPPGAAAAGGRRKPAAENRPGERRASFKNLAAIKINNGAPTGAVIAPVASSCGATSVRAAISASTSASAPPAQRGQRRADVFRHQTAHHVRHHQPDEADRPGHRHRRAAQQRNRQQTQQPRLDEINAKAQRHLIPSASTLRRGAMSSATPRPISAGTSAVCSVLQFSPAVAGQPVRIASSVCSSRINIAAVTADANPDSATPHNVMRSGVAPPRPAEASAITPPNSSPAPQAAVSGRPTGKRRETGPAPRSPPPPARRRR